MAELYSTDSQADAQASASRGFIEARQLTQSIRRLRRIVRDLHTLRQNAPQYFCCEAAREAPRESSKLKVEPFPQGEAPPEDEGEYRTFYLSPLHLRFEKEYLQRHDVESPLELLDIARDILASYCGLIQNMAAGTDPLDDALSSMGKVLQLASNAVCSAYELYRNMERVAALK